MGDGGGGQWGGVAGGVRAARAWREGVVTVEVQAWCAASVGWRVMREQKRRREGETKRGREGEKKRRERRREEKEEQTRKKKRRERRRERRGRREEETEERARREGVVTVEVA